MVWEGRSREASPYPDLSNPFAVKRGGRSDACSRISGGRQKTSRKPANSSTTRSFPTPGRISCFSSTHVCACGMNTAFNPAPIAGLMSDFGLFPTIHVDPASMPRAATRSRYARVSFSFTIAV